MSYRPPHDSRKRPSPSLVRESRPGSMWWQVVAVIGLFLLVRILMVESEMLFVNIPVIDPMLRDVLVVIQRQLTIYGLME